MTGKTDAGYAEFKNSILEELCNFYGSDASLIETTEACGDDGQVIEGILIVMGDKEEGAVPVANLHDLYMEYASGKVDFYGCIEVIYREREKQVHEASCTD